MSFRRCEEVLLLDSELAPKPGKPRTPTPTRTDAVDADSKYPTGRPAPRSAAHVVASSVRTPAPALHIKGLCAGWPVTSTSTGTGIGIGTGTGTATCTGTGTGAGAGTGMPIATGPVQVPRHKHLNNIHLAVEFGQLAVVMGKVGAGKSTLLLAILGELRHEGASAVHMLARNVLYAPQQPWVFPATFRDNICFTYAYDAAWFRQVCAACALERDVSLFLAGELTQIGERGVTLSGGQKARVSLARTLYATKFAGVSSEEKRCIVLLDDPFAAVDPSVGE